MAQGRLDERAGKVLRCIKETISPFIVFTPSPSQPILSPKRPHHHQHQILRHRGIYRHQQALQQRLLTVPRPCILPSLSSPSYVSPSANVSTPYPVIFPSTQSPLYRFPLA